LAIIALSPDQVRLTQAPHARQWPQRRCRIESEGACGVAGLQKFGRVLYSERVDGFAGLSGLSKMTDNDVLADGEELNADLALLENLRLARKSFLDAICDASATQEPDVLLTLRLESTYQFAEFLFLLRAQGIYRENRIKALVELHNQYIVDVTKDPVKLARLGL